MDSAIYVIGIGQTPVGEFWDQSLENLSAQAIRQALADAGDVSIDAMYVGNLLASAASGQANLGPKIADNAGLHGIEALTVEAGEASGAAALRMAFFALRSGFVRTALVVGVEKYTDMVGSGMEAILAHSGDYDFEGMQGLTPSGQAGLLMRRYLDLYQPERAALGVLPILAHANGVHNPNAMYRRAISNETYAGAAMVSNPLNVFDSAPYADGAAALILTADAELAEKRGGAKIVVAAGNTTADALALHDRPEALAFSAVTLSLHKALLEANLEMAQMDLFEVWDAFSITALLSIEACGLAAHGAGWRWLMERDLSPGGSLPMVTMGGNKARGFPLGAAGVYQAVEATLQLRGQAGKNQVAGAKHALIQALGGPASTVVTHILSKIA